MMSPSTSSAAVRRTVRKVLETVRTGGDEAVRQLTKRLDGVDLASPVVPMDRARDAWRALPREVRRALDACAQRLAVGQRALLPRATRVRTSPGVQLITDWVPLRRVGAYAPGGRAAYPSTVIMTCVPATIAGVRERLLASPPRSDGGPSSLVLAAAWRAGATHMFAMGGAQALAAFAYGTPTVPRVDKIVGPGNAFVLEAKRQLFGEVGIDSLAGPSELGVWADETADVDTVVLDAAAQAEHDPLARVTVVTDSGRVARQVRRRFAAFRADAGRAEILRESLRERAQVLLVRDAAEGARTLENLAPEHVEIPGRHAASFARRLTRAGTIFEGPYARASLGDYVTGANHVIPTGGAAAWSGPLSVHDFLRMRVRQRVTRAALRRLAPAAATLARAEGLPHHAASIEGGRAR